MACVDVWRDDGDIFLYLVNRSLLASHPRDAIRRLPLARTQMRSSTISTVHVACYLVFQDVDQTRDVKIDSGNDKQQAIRDFSLWLVFNFVLIFVSVSF